MLLNCLGIEISLGAGEQDSVTLVNEVSVKARLEYATRVLGPHGAQRALGLSNGDVFIGWQSDETKPSPLNDSKLSIIHGVGRAIEKTRPSQSDPEMVKAFLTNQSVYLEGQRPDDLIARLSPREAALLLERTLGPMLDGPL